VGAAPGAELLGEIIDLGAGLDGVALGEVIGVGLCDPGRRAPDGGDELLEAAEHGEARDVEGDLEGGVGDGGLGDEEGRHVALKARGDGGAEAGELGGVEQLEALAQGVVEAVERFL
jgi:hypothetical protein